MATVNTNLTFSTEQQSLWRPGPAVDLTIDSGDAMIWDPDPIVKDFGFDVLGFSLSAQFFLDVRFGLLAYASLGTGGDFDADYNISLTIELPAAIIAGDMMTFDYRTFEVTSSSITTDGFGTPESSSVGKIGAGLDLIIDVETGFRNVVFGHWFGEEGPFDFTILNIHEQIPLIEVDLLSPEFELELTDGVTLTARLPTGASIGESTSSGGGGVVSGEGASERQFLSLDADLDALLVRLLNKIPAPPVQAIAKFLGDVVFAEHSYDIGDYLPGLGKGNASFNFTLLDVTANAGAMVTEEVSLDINRAGTEIPDILITLTSDNGTAGDTSDDIITRGLLGEVLSLASPDATGTGTAVVTATYEINRGTFFHGVGVGINASITIDALSGYLGGAWVPDFLGLSFGPLFTTTIPDGGLQINLGNLYEDTFEIDGSVFNTQTETYNVFYVEEGLAPTGWNPDLPNAEETIYAYFQAAHDQLAAIQSQYSNSGFLLKPPVNDPPATSYNYATGPLAEAQKVMFIYTGLFDQAVTLNTTNGSVATVDLATNLPSAATLTARHGTTGNFLASGSNNAFVYNSLVAIASNPDAVLRYQVNGKVLTSNESVNVEGSSNADAIILYKDSTSFIDGGGNTNLFGDLFVANFATYYGDVAIRWDMQRSILEEQDGNPATVGGITLFSDTPGLTELTVRNIERAALRTGGGDDYLVGASFGDLNGGFGDIFITGGGDDIVIMPADRSRDLTSLEAGDDAYVSGFLPISFAVDVQDVVYGGTGIDQAFISTGINGMRYDIIVDTFESATPVRRFGATSGIGAQASFVNVAQFYGDLQNMGYSIFAADPGSVSVPVTPASPTYYVSIQDGGFGFSTRFAQDFEYISIVDGGPGDDLAIFMGGTRYEGGGGTDTFAADFVYLEPYFGTRTGINVVVGRAGIDGFYGETIIDGFERLLVHGTTADDVLRGGTLADYLDGDGGNDVLAGGNDTVADEIYGGDGNDLIFWGNDGADTITGGNQTDRLEISADGLEDHGLRYRFVSFTTGQVLAGSEIFYWAYDPAALLLDALDYTKTLSVNYSMDLSFTGSIFAKTYQLEVTNIRGSVLQDDVLLYQGGNVYIGGETAGDQDVFVADLTGINSALNFTITDDEALDGSDGYLLGNFIYLDGIDRGVIRSGGGDDRMMGGRLNDYFETNGGNDTLYGAGGDNGLFGGAGNDLFIWMAEGNDTMSGGAFRNFQGRDVLLQAGGDADSSLRMFDAAGVELTTFGPLTAASSHADMESAILNSLFAARFVYDAGSFTLDYTNMSKVEFAGTDAHNEIVVFQFGSSYWGGESIGDADLFAGDFRFDVNPTVSFGDMTFDARIDGVYEAGTGLRIGGFERFHLQLGAGNHLVVGGDLGDAVYGNGGFITFLSGTGDDLFQAGADGSLFDHTGGNDTVFGSGSIGAIDVLSYNATGAVEVTQFGSNSVQIGPVLSRVGGLQDMSVFQAALTAPVGQTLVTHGSNSILHNGISEFFATGSAENDVLLGGFGQNLLIGGNGDDVMIVRQGNSVMIGGAGADTYVFDGLFGNALILNETGVLTDTILMFTGAAYAELAFANDGIDLLITTSPAGFIDSTVRIVGYFATGPNGYNFAMMTTDGFFTIDLSFLGAYTGLAVPARTVVNGTGDSDDFGAGNHIGREIHMGGGEDFALAGSGADLFFGGSGQDGVSYRNATGGVTVDLQLQAGTGNDAEGDLYSSIEHAAGSLFGDLMIGSNFANTLVSDAGDDSLYGGDGDDGLYGGSGADSIDGGNDDDVIQGGEGNDTLLGGAGSDIMFGGDGADSIEGGDDADLIQTGDGNDTVHGGGGDDILIYTRDGLDEFHGDGGTDWINFENHAAGVTVNLLTGAQVESYDAEGNPTILATLTGIENIRGTVEGDNLFGDDQDNVIDGVLGSDYMVGHAGNDTFIGGGQGAVVDYSQETGGQGVDLVFQAFTPGLSAHIAGTDSHGDTDLLFNITSIGGTSFADNIQGNDNDNVIEGFDGDDFLDGLSGDDDVSGSGGNDNLRGFFGNDTLFGGSGINSMLGEDGNDRSVSSQDATFDNHFGGAGFDIASYEFFDEGVEVIGGTQVWKNGVQIGLLDSIEHFIGTSGNDVIQLGSYPDPFTPTGYLEVYSYTGGFDQVHGRALFTGGETLSYALFGAAVEVRMVTGITRTTDSEIIGMGTYRSITSFTNIRTVIGSDFSDQLDGAEIVPLGTTTNFSNLYGGNGNDTLIGRGGRTELYGGAGDDYLQVYIPLDPFGESPFARYIVDGGEGFDFLKITGVTAWDISLTGQYNNLELGGVEGLIGSTGSDTLEGNAGANTFRGEGGNDVFLGRDGNDVLIYTAGVDTFTGGNGLDTYDLSELGLAVRVNLGLAIGTVQTNDTGTASGGIFRDLANSPDLDVENAIGSDFNDSLIGNAGTNLLNGGLGNDTLMGQGGNDVLVYTAGLDQWFGGSGADTGSFATFGFAIDADLARAGVSVFHRGGTNVISGTAVDMATLASVENVLGTVHDDLILGNAAANVLWGNGGNDRLSGQDGNDSVFGGDAGDTIFGGTGNDSLMGGLTGADLGDSIDAGNGNDTVFGGGGADTILGQSGNDNLRAEDGDDTVDGGTGNDTLYGGRGADMVAAGSGNDVASGGEGNDTASGDAGFDTLDGGTGDDVLSGGANSDTLNGGDGNDTLTGGAAADVMDGGTGFDMVSYADVTSVVSVQLGEGAAAAVTGSAAAGDVITNAEGLIGTTRNDTLTGNSAANRLLGGLGNDVLTGLGGNDVLDGGDRDDTLAGGDGIDLLRGGSGIDLVDGGSGDDLMYGDDGTDTLYGGDGQDEIYGGAGTDLVEGNAGDDKLGGDGGADTLRGGAGIDALYGGEADDVLTGGSGGDALYGGTGNDTADYALAATGVTANLLIAALNLGEASGDIYDSIENLTGSAFADRLSGTDLANRINGGGGNDTIYGQGGNDTLDGGEGDDDLYGGTGTDSILGGNGQDRLYGGSISDNLSGDAGNDLILGDALNDTIAGGAGNDTVYGGTGADRIHAGPGTDSIFGGSEVDTFVFLAANELGSGAAIDTIHDFATGIDRLDLSGVQTGLSFIGGLDFSNVAGQMRYTITSGVGRLRVDLDGDGLSDGSIFFQNGVNLQAADFVL